MFRAMKLKWCLRRLATGDNYELLGMIEDLIDWGDIFAFDPLVAQLQLPHLNWPTVSRAIAALGKLGDVRAIVHLRPFVLSHDRQAARKACDALAKLGEPEWAQCRLRRSEHSYVSDHDIGTPDIGEMCKRQTIHGVDMISFFIAALTDTRCSHRYAAQGLRAGGERAVMPLIGFIENALAKNDYSWSDEDHSVFFEVEALGMLRDRRAVETLIQVLGTIGKGKNQSPMYKDTRTLDRVSAAQALGMLGDTGAVEPLIAALKDEDACVRDAAAEALGKIGDIRAVEPLIEAMVARHVEPAIKALGELRDPRSFTGLAQVAKDGNRFWPHGGRYQAIESLALIPDSRVADVLVSICEDAPVLVRREVCRHVACQLKRMGDPRAAQCEHPPLI